MKKLIAQTSAIFGATLFLFVGCSKKTESKHYVVGEDFDEKAFIEEEMSNSGFDVPKGNFVYSEETDETDIETSDDDVFNLCEVPDLSLFKYGLNATSDGVVISDYTGNNITNLKIPEEIEGFPVTEIEKLGSHNEIKSILIPDSVKKIENFCFSYWDNLEFVHLPISLEIICYDLFSNCENLKNIKIPENVKKIEDNAFYNTGIKSIDVPNNVKELEGSVFSGCKNLEKINLPNSLTNLPARIFQDCESLKEIDIPTGIKEIPKSAFSNCTSLQKVNIPNTVNIIRAYAFFNCTSLSELVIPNSVTTIENAFDEAGLVSLELPDSVVDLGISATIDEKRCTFANLNKLEHLKLSNSLEELSEGFFHDYVGNTKLKNLKTLNIPTSCKFIFGSHVFSDFTSLEELIIPDSLEQIHFNSNEAFSGTKLSLKTQARLRQLSYEGEF